MQQKPVGVHSLDHFSIVVPDLAEANAFYTTFGLTTRPDGSDLTLHTANDPHRWGRFREGASKQIDYLSFGAYAADMPAFIERIARHGAERAEAPPHAYDDTGLWFRDPDGTLLEIRIADKVSPSRKSPANNPPGAEGIAAAPLRANATRVHPTHLSHVLIFTSDVARAIAFYTDVVGLGLSDAAGDGIAFMHGIHGSDHHLVAFAKSDARGFHHCSWNVDSTNDVGLGAMQMADAGHAKGWGLGRHVLGSNYFHYVRDPWGGYSEYSHDIDFVPGDGSWKPSHVSPENGFYLWGPQPPHDFAVNYESPSASLLREVELSRADA